MSAAELRLRILSLEQSIGASALFVVTMLTHGATSVWCGVLSLCCVAMGWRLNYKANECAKHP